ncbi:MAG: hypothetical protein ACR2I2_00940 [Bryobacteraceae bacterium]
MYGYIIALLLPLAAFGAGNCTFTLAPDSASIPALGGAGQFSLSAGSSDCTRTALMPPRVISS